MGKWDALAKDKDCDQKRTEMASKVSDALSEDAMKISMDLGLGKLIQPDGVPKLVAKMREQASQQELERARAQSMADLELKSSRRPLKLKMRDQLLVSKLTKADNSASLPSFKHDISSIQTASHATLYQQD